MGGQYCGYLQGWGCCVFAIWLFWLWGWTFLPRGRPWWADRLRFSVVTSSLTVLSLTFKSPRFRRSTGSRWWSNRCFRKCTYLNKVKETDDFLLVLPRIVVNELSEELVQLQGDLALEFGHICSSPSMWAPLLSNFCGLLCLHSFGITSWGKVKMAHNWFKNFLAN